MNLEGERVDVHVPDGVPLSDALARTTHLAVGAHQDDAEFMAYHGIESCFGRSDRWFLAVIATDGSGSPRDGVYADCTDERMRAIRRGEQRAAADVGRYSAAIQLNYPSSAAKDPGDTRLTDDLTELFRVARPELVYLHNPADKHPTHVACCMRALIALRRLEPAERPRRVLGCEVWRDLDWLPDARKVALDVGGRPHLAHALAGVFDSQIAAGKRYDLAALGRRQAHATFHESHGTDRTSALTFAMDLTPLLETPSFEPDAFVAACIRALKDEILKEVRTWK